MDTIPRHILWSKDQIDLTDEWQRRWYIRQVLMYGRAEDVASLDWDEVERLLPELHLPPCFINSGRAASMLEKEPVPHGTLNGTQIAFLTRFNQLPDATASTQRALCPART